MQHLSPEKKYFSQLDGLRCIAVMLVLISHWLNYPYIKLLPFGPMGVDLFFVLSGFLITRILLLSKDENKVGSIFVPIKRFYIRRTLRIFPIYYLTLFFLLIIKYPEAQENIAWLATYTFNIRSALPNLGDLGNLTHLWSLSVEEQFYIIFPLLIFLIPYKKMKSFFYGIIIIGVLTRLFLYIIAAPIGLLYALTPCCLDAFGIGSLLAFYLLYEISTLEKILKKSYLFILTVIIFILITLYLKLYIKQYEEGKIVLQRFLFSICCFWVIGQAALNRFKGFIRWSLESRVMVFIGKISYGIYIYHYFIFVLLIAYLDPFLIKHFHISKTYFLNPAFTYNNVASTAILLFTITICVATLSWYLIEQPINKLKEKIK